MTDTNAHTHNWDDRDGFCADATCRAHISQTRGQCSTDCYVPPVASPELPQPIDNDLRRQVLTWVAEAVEDLPWTPEGLGFVLRKAANGIEPSA